MTVSEIVLGAAWMVGGVLLTLACEAIREKYRFRRELKQNNYFDLSGYDWFAAWQTSVGHQELINTEEIIIEQKGALVKIHNREKSRENPKGGYRWVSQMRFYFGRDLMGEYFSVPEEQNALKGIMYFNYDSAKKRLIGRWVGSSYDSPLSSGFGVISKNKAEAVETLKQLIKNHPDKVPIITISM